MYSSIIYKKSYILNNFLNIILLKIILLIQYFFYSSFFKCLIYQKQFLKWKLYYELNYNNYLNKNINYIIEYNKNTKNNKINYSKLFHFLDIKRVLNKIYYNFKKLKKYYGINKIFSFNIKNEFKYIIKIIEKKS